MVKFELDEYHRNIPDSDLLNDLQSVAAALQQTSLTKDSYTTHGGKYSSNTIEKRFGSWNKALTLAGIAVSTRRNIPNEELFANLESLWRHLGRQPRYDEVCKPLSSFSPVPYTSRFGSWRKALEAFVDFINKEEKAEDTSENVLPNISSSTETISISGRSRHINWRTRFLVMRRDDFKCGYCGRSPANNPGLELHIDHVQAFSKDGPSTIDNLRTACNVCNIGKSNLSVNSNGFEN